MKTRYKVLIGVVVALAVLIGPNALAVYLAL